MKTNCIPEKYKNVRLSQGVLLITEQTKKWSDKERKQANYEEQCMAFANFTSLDEGRSREFVARFHTPFECEMAVKMHNDNIKHFNI